MEYCVQRLQVIHVQYKKIAQTWHTCFLMWMVVTKNFQKASQYYISLSGMWFIFLMNQHDIALIDDPCHQKINCYIKCCLVMNCLIFSTQETDVWIYFTKDSKYRRNHVSWMPLCIKKCIWKQIIGTKDYASNQCYFSKQNRFRKA